MRLSKFFTIAALSGLLSLSGSSAWADEQAKIDMLGDLTRAVLMGGNGIYRVHVENAAGGNCGTWTATTGPLHPAGPGLNVLYGGGFPGTSNTTLRSYTSGIDYITGGGGTCTDICVAASAPVTTPILNGATIVGYQFDWTLADGGNSIGFRQIVVVVGPVDGSETVSNTVVRETHTVTNNGPGSFSFGVRKHWDWQIGPDDGPWFGDCDTATAACDRSMNLTADGSLNGFYPQSYVINQDPATSLCPPGVAPNDPDGCTGNPPYIVAGTVEPPSTLSPVPDAPELLQFNSWPSTFSVCWEPGLADNVPCGNAGDTAVAYFYGRTVGTAQVLASGSQRGFTQYIVAGEDACPEILTPGACCNDATGVCTIELESDCMFRYGGDGSDCSTIMPPCTFCGNGVVEGTEQCDLGAANGTPGSCCSATCTFVSAGTVCRPSAGPCDAAESCSGMAAACPPDGFTMGGVCRPAAGDCDVAESCDGSGVNCPPDGFVAGGTVCRPSAGVCDVAESCSGMSAGCPADGFAIGGVCRPAAGDCDVAESCNGTGANCPPDGLVAAGTVCRASAGACDLAEACTGGNAACPADVFAVGGVCRAAAGPCDVAESCNGSGINCPPDGFSSGNECRGSTGDCDPAENCDGTGAACPQNVVINACGPTDGCCPPPLGSCSFEEDVDCPFVDNGIPTVSEWGLVVLTLLLLAGWKVYFGRTSPVSANRP